MQIKTKIILSTTLVILLSIAVFITSFITMLEIYNPDITATIRGLENGSNSKKIVTLTLEDRIKFKSHLQLITAISFTSVLAVASLIVYYMTKKFLYPIRILTEAAKRINNNDLSVPIVHNRNDEFKDVCQSFNQMQTHLLEEINKTASYEKSRIDMITGISHDLRTPLTSVKGYIKGIKDGIANTPEKQQEYLQIAYKKATEMDLLLTKLFKISKLETGNLLIEKEKFELTEIVKQYVRELKLTLVDSSFEIMVQSETKLYINGDIEQICQIFLNLVTNSIKYANSFPLKIKIQLKKQNKMVQIKFSDNGVGVCKNDLYNLFKQFWRGDRSRSSSNPNGSGLGLYIVKTIVNGHDGIISAYNEQGLTVEINLPEYEGA